MTQSISLEANKSLIQRLYEELWNKRNIAVADELIAKDFVNHDLAPGESPGIQGFKETFNMITKAFPDTHIAVDFMVAERDMISYRLSVRGTNRGVFMGTPATGNQVTYTGTSTARIRDGKIVEHWENFDFLGMMRQLGIIPTG